jgi:hypothetical protein
MWGVGWKIYRPIFVSQMIISYKKVSIRQKPINTKKGIENIVF